MLEKLTVNGTDLNEQYGLWVTDAGAYNTPARDVTTYQIPGRNGNLIIDNGKFNNVTIEYPCVIYEDFEDNYQALCAELLSTTGYVTISDTARPGYFRLGRYESGLNPALTVYRAAGTFKLAFDCKPQLFLDSGETAVQFTASNVISNPTLFSSRPLLRVYSSGTITVGGVEMTIESMSSFPEYIDIDCASMQVHYGATNYGDKVTISGGKYPELPPGNSNIVLNGVSKVVVTPRWWTV